MRLTAYSTIVFLLLPNMGMTQATGTSSISGHVLSTAGHSVRAIVGLRFTAARGVPTRTHRTLTAQDGSFTFQKLSAGQYQLCAQIPQSEAARSALPFVDSCSWGSNNQPITVAAGQQLTGVNFEAPNGTYLQIRVNDPGQLLPQVLPPKGPPTLEPELQLVVKGPDKRVHHAQFVSKDVGGRNYRMVVPLNTALGVTINSSVAQPLDSTGNLVNAPVGLQTATGAPLGPMTFTLHQK